MATPGGAAIAARFGDNLRHARKDAGLSQEEAGIRASLHRTEVGLHHTRVGQIIRGE